jgi:hypothetical protein
MMICVLPPSASSGKSVCRVFDASLIINTRLLREWNGGEGREGRRSYLQPFIPPIQVYDQD